jgi:Xaa-Pro aminopeptidase
MRRDLWLLPTILVALGASLFAQPIFTGIFPPEEFAARRAKVMARIGEGVAILQGATERPGEQPLRQNNQFFYLTGVVEPRAILVIDGKAKRSTLYLYGGAERRERMFGSAMVPGDAAGAATGIEAALPRDEFAKAVEAFAREGRTFYTPFRPEVLGSASASDAAASARATKDDPWDGRPSREEAFIQKLRALASQVNGKFTPRQREFYTIYLRLYQALMTSIKVHARPGDIIKEAVAKMDAVMADFKFADPKIKEAATRFVERYRASKANSLGHTIGLEVHDVRLPTDTLEPGQIFTIEPAMTIPDEHIGVRLEDVILITETGYENLSAFVPIEIAEIEKLMTEPGLSDKQRKQARQR